MSDAAADMVKPEPDKPPVLPTTGATSGAVVHGIVGVMSKIKEIRKGGWNKDGKYEFVMMSDVMAAVQDALVIEKLAISQREISRKIVQKIMVITYQFDIYHESGECIYNIGSHSGACRWEFKSGTVDDKAVSKCYVSAHKYFVLNLFKIPPDDHSTERMTDTTEADEQHGDREPPEDRPGARREPDRRRDDPPRERPRDDRPPPDQPPPEPPPHIDAPFREPPAGRWDDGPPPSPPDVPYASGGINPPPNDPAEATFRAQVMALKRKLEAAQSENDAHDIWKDNAELLGQLANMTYEFLREAYLTRWTIYPPAV